MFKRLVSLLTIVMVLAFITAPAAAATADKGTVTVTGHAEITVAPDVAYITAGIITNGPDVESARRDNDQIMRRIIDALVAQGVDKSRIATSRFSLQPLYRADGKENTIIGYRLQNSVTVMVEDLAKVGPVIDAAFAAGANQFQGLRFAVKDDGKLRDELLKRAVQDGRRKAAIMADALGVALGSPQSVSEAGRYGNVVADNLPAFKLAAGAPVPVEAGQLTLGIDVNIVYNMQ